MVNGKKLIALCTSRVFDPQVHGYIKALTETLRTDNCALMIFTINTDIYWVEDLDPAETHVYELMPYRELDCIIIMDEKIKSRKVSERIISRAKQENVPVVVVDGRYEGTIHVNFDYEAGFEAITRHVIEHHHVRRPHMMAGLPNNPFSDRRIDIFKKVIKENGIEFNDSMLSYGDFWADPARIAMREILKRDELPDAIICANDIMAITVTDELREAGVKVPDQVIVSGFDGYDEIYFADPIISTCSCDTELLAEATGQIALKLAQGQPASDAYIEPELQVNASCGCPPHSRSVRHLRESFNNNNFYRHQDDTRILNDITSNMECCTDVWSMASAIHDHKTKKHLLVVDRNIFNMEENYFMADSSASKVPDYHMIYDADYAEEHRFDRIPLDPDLFNDPTVNTETNVLSGNFRNRIIELLNIDYPLVFNSVNYMNRPYGFVCAYYEDFVITDYARTTIVTNALGMGVGGFVNLQYQRYLLQKMDDMYKHDALTGLYNRLGFQKVYAERIQKDDYQGISITIIMSDLDGLKYINDNFGHADGDHSIAAVAEALKRAVPENALSARFGGDELFSVIFGECDPDSIIRKIDEYLERYNAEQKLPYTVTTSCGFNTTTLTPEVNILKMLKLADERMYIVKRAKRDIWHGYGPGKTQ